MGAMAEVVAQPAETRSLEGSLSRVGLFLEKVGGIETVRRGDLERAIGAGVVLGVLTFAAWQDALPPDHHETVSRNLDLWALRGFRGEGSEVAMKLDAVRTISSLYEALTKDTQLQNAVRDIVGAAGVGVGLGVGMGKAKAAERVPVSSILVAVGRKLQESGRGKAAEV